jgi:16S rRNA (guanine527-N7)-methyltransferase
MSTPQRLVRGLAAMGLDLPQTAPRRLLAYLALLARWNRVHNLTALRDAERMVSHHLLDSLAVLPYVDALTGTAAPAALLDVGSGGGLPGIPLAIARPGMAVTLLDSVAKKAAFLNQVRAELALDNVRVVCGRVESFAPEAAFPLIISRAFARLGDFVSLTAHLLAPGGHWLAMKGRDPAAETADLPAGVRVAAVHALGVPEVDAPRHLVVLERAA